MILKCCVSGQIAYILHFKYTWTIITFEWAMCTPVSKTKRKMKKQEGRDCREPAGFKITCCNVELGWKPALSWHFVQHSYLYRSSKEKAAKSKKTNPECASCLSGNNSTDQLFNCNSPSLCMQSFPGAGVFLAYSHDDVCRAETFVH